MNKQRVLNLGKVVLCASLQLPGFARAEIGMEAAARIALERVPGQVQGIEREPALGRAAFEVEIRDQAGRKYEVLVAADDGKILDVKLDD